MEVLATAAQNFSATKATAGRTPAFDDRTDVAAFDAMDHLRSASELDHRLAPHLASGGWPLLEPEVLGLLRNAEGGPLKH